MSIFIAKKSLNIAIKKLKKNIEAPISGLSFKKAIYFEIFLLYYQKQNS